LNTAIDDLEGTDMRRLVSLLCAGALLTAVPACDDDSDGASGTPPMRAASTPGPRNVMNESEFADLEPGTWFIDPDGDDATPLRVTYTVASDGWSQWVGAAKFADDGQVGLSITTIDNLVRDGCRDHRPAEPAVGPTVDDLVTALTNLAPFEVSAPPTDVTILGHHGKHLELTVPVLAVTGAGDKRQFADCADGELHSWIAKNLGGSFRGYNAEPGRTEQFWILDVNGTRLALVTNASPNSPPQDVAQLRAMFDSMQIQP
jgi:hypothetical protein